MNRIGILIVFSTLSIFTSCTYSSLLKKSANQKITLEPVPLTLEGDMVNFELAIELPPNMLEKNWIDRKTVQYQLVPEFQYGNQTYTFSEKITFDADEKPIEGKLRKQASFSFPYKEEMIAGKLAVKSMALDLKTGSTKLIATEELTKGILATSQLARLGKFSRYESNPFLGYLMDHGYGEKVNAQNSNISFAFAQGSSSLGASELNTADGRKLKDILSGQNVLQSVTITGYHSPDNTERTNRSLPLKRAQEIERHIKDEAKKLGHGWKVNQTKFVTKTVQEDWFEFRLKLVDYNKIGQEEKDQYYNIIFQEGSFANQERELQKLRSYSAIYRDVYPQLRTVKVEIETGKSLKSDPEIASMAHKIVKGERLEEDVVESELAYAATLTPDWNEKMAIYEAQAKMFFSHLAYNNLGVVYLNQANRSVSTADKNEWINKALEALAYSQAIQENAHANYNLGLVHLLRGDRENAGFHLYKAIGLTKDEELKNLAESSLAGLDILNGDYKLALIHLQKAEENDINLFNKGLANFLIEDFHNADEAFEQSAMLNRDSGYGFYGLALLAARIGDEPRLYENLTKATQANADLKKRAIVDLAFKNYFQKEGFRNAVR